MPRLEVLHPDLVLFALVVDVAVGRRLRLLLVLKERIVEYLVIDVDFSHLWLHALAHLLLERLGLISLGGLLPQLADPGLLNEVRQLEGNLVDAALVLQITTLLRPVPRHRDRVPDLFALEEEEWVLRGHVPRFYQVWPPHLHLEVENFHL